MNPCKREFLVQQGEPGELRVELRRGGGIFAVRTFATARLDEAVKLGAAWMAVGPAVLALHA